MQKLWHFLPAPNPEQVGVLAEALHVNSALAQLLYQRGVHDFDEAKYFFRPDLDNLYDPFEMKDMDVAVTRIIEAFENNQRILIYGDYDVDGTTSVSMMVTYLRTYHPHIEFYIPDRYSEGYGVSSQGILWANDHDIDLIISLDCGINAFETIDQANSFGIDFIVCDHHRPEAELPKAVAILDPKRVDCDYPFKELSGCGVGFKLLQALTDTMSWPDEPLLDMLDLVAVSIAADIVPIVDENRTLAYYGLRKINQAPRPGLAALINIGGLKHPLTITNVVFGIAPRINAAGRIAHAHGAVDLLLSQNEEEAEYMAGQVNSNNVIRREHDSGITTEALDIINGDAILMEAKSTVLYKEDWHKGVIGIVASKCIEHFHRPTIILTESNGKATGSARSVPGFDIHDAIGACRELLEQFGGHKYAAGLTMNIENIEAFTKKFETVVSETITAEQLVPKVNIDLEIDLSDITQKFFSIIQQMEPFGPGNMSPVFVSRGLTAKSSRLLKDLHLKLTVTQGEANPNFDCIGFNMAEFYPEISNGTIFEMAYVIEENNFRGNKTLQLNIKDIKFEKI